MSRNKNLRKAIAGLEASIAKHEAKIRDQLMSQQIDEDKIAAWRREVRVWQERISRLTRRLKREW